MLIAASWVVQTQLRGPAWSWAATGAWALFGLSLIVAAAVAASWLMAGARSIAQVQSRAVALFLLQLVIAGPAWALDVMTGPTGLVAYAASLLSISMVAARLGPRLWHRDEVLARR